MISLVVVSHSPALASAALDLAEQMVPAEQRPRVALAAGDDDGGLGTNPVAVMEALSEVGTPDGVLVLVDLGSAVLSAELAVELASPDFPVLVSPAPLVEGLVAALVTASSGAPLETVEKDARHALWAKQEHLAVEGPEEERPHRDPATDSDATPTPPPPTDDAVVTARVVDRAGLHTRPSAAVVTALTGIDAEVTVSRRENPTAVADARSIIELASLGVRGGDDVVVRARGPQAARAAEVVAEVLGRMPVCQQEVDLDTAVSQVCEFIDGLGNGPQARQIMAALPTLVRDPALLGEVRDRLGRGDAPGEAALLASNALAQRFAQLPGPLGLRAQDVRMVGRLLARALEAKPLTDQIPDGVVLVDELDAVTAARLDPARHPIVRVRTRGDQAHGPIIAREAGIQVVTGWKG